VATVPEGGKYFPSVRKAREALKVRAHELMDGYIATIKQAAAAGDYESALKGYQHLMNHMPEEEGERIMDVDVDKPKQIEGYTGPAVQIGIVLGGLNKELPPATAIEPPVVEVIDVTNNEP